MDLTERRARLALRHRLAATRTDDVVGLAGDLVGLHATDPATVYLAARARMREPSVSAVESELYDTRRLVKMLGMRRTVFVVPRELAPVVQAACTDAIATGLRRRYAKLLEQGGIAPHGASWLDETARETLSALETLGEAFGAELSTHVPRLREKLHYGEGTKWAGTQSVTTMVLTLLGAEGSLVRGRPRGGWTSSQHRWMPAEPLARPDAATARVELVRRWLAAFGPGTVADLKWWTGWTMRDVRAALSAAAPVEVEVDGATGLVLADDDEPTLPTEPWAAFLPALDPTVMGWTDRGWYLGEHAAALFDRSGNAGPTVWWDGRIVGGWAQRRDGEVVWRLLEDVGADATAATEAEAARLAGWLGDVRVTPRFRTPLERELSAA